MLPDEVRKAVERWDSYLHARATSLSVTATPTLHEWQTIRAHMLAREAEVERLQNIADGNAELYQHELLRTERADALLRECLINGMDAVSVSGEPCVRDRITAHLSENSRG